MMDLHETSYKAYNTALKRAGNVPQLSKKQWLKNLAGEVIELQEAITKFNETDPKESEKQTAAYNGVKEEVADCFIYAMMIAFDYGIDIEKEIQKKMFINEKRALGIGDKL